MKRPGKEEKTIMKGQPVASGNVDQDTWLKATGALG
jgi:hypothetical protein